MNIQDKIIFFGAELQAFIDGHLQQDSPDDDDIFTLIEAAKRIKARKVGRLLQKNSIRQLPWRKK